MPKNEPAASTPSRLPALAAVKAVAPLLAAPAPEELASVLPANLEVEMLASGVGTMLVSDVIVGLLASVAADVELLVVMFKVGMVPVVTSAVVTARCE